MIQDEKDRIVLDKLTKARLWIRPPVEKWWGTMELELDILAKELFLRKSLADPTKVRFRLKGYVICPYTGVTALYEPEEQDPD